MHEVGVANVAATKKKVDGLLEADTFGRLLDEWVAHGELRGRSPNTADGYKRKIEATIRPELGSIPVADLTSRMIDDFYGRLVDAGTSPATVVHYHRIISAALTQDRKWGAVPTNVPQNATPPFVPKKVMTIPPPEQVRALIELAAASRSPE